MDEQKNPEQEVDFLSGIHKDAQILKGKQPAAIGRIVLYKTRDGDRPMLITKIWSTDTVNGIVFLDSHNDRILPMPGMREGSMTVWATSVFRGKNVNQWRFYDE